MKALTISIIALTSVAAFAPAHADEFEFRFQSYELDSAPARDALLNRLEGMAGSFLQRYGPQSARDDFVG